MLSAPIQRRYYSSPRGQNKDYNSTMTSVGVVTSSVTVVTCVTVVTSVSVVTTMTSSLVPRPSRGRGPGDTWQNSFMCSVSIIA